MPAFGWKLYGDGRTPPPGAAVRPDERVRLAAGTITGAGGVTMQITKNFSLGGIALGTTVTIVMYHLVRPFAPRRLREASHRESPSAQTASLDEEKAFAGAGLTEDVVPPRRAGEPRDPAENP